MTDTMTQQGIAYCDQVIAESGIYENEFFCALREETMTLEEFRLTQEQFYFAVLFFARPMTALIARFPNPKTRLSGRYGPVRVQLLAISTSTYVWRPVDEPRMLGGGY